MDLLKLNLWEEIGDFGNLKETGAFNPRESSFNTKLFQATPGIPITVATAGEASEFKYRHDSEKKESLYSILRSLEWPGSFNESVAALFLSELGPGELAS